MWGIGTGDATPTTNYPHKLTMLPSWGLPTVYFIRHGQAGSRQDYDRLSDVGREQADLLGAWLARRRMHFDEAWSGRLNRQRGTAEAVRQGYQNGGGDAFPPIRLHPCWDEFDLDAVYRGIAPQLAAHDPEFRGQCDDLERQAGDAASPVHRAWAKCDTTIIRAWIDGRYEFEGESYQDFVTRVSNAPMLTGTMLAGTGNVAVFTSATPAAVWAAKALDLTFTGLGGRKTMQLAGVTYNTGVTVVKVDAERVRLFQFNTVPHIEAAELLTHR